MKIFCKEYLNLQSNATVRSHWCRTFAGAKKVVVKGEGYMQNHPNYTLEYREAKVSFLDWVLGR